MLRGDRARKRPGRGPLLAPERVRDRAPTGRPEVSRARLAILWLDSDHLHASAVPEAPSKKKTVPPRVIASLALAVAAGALSALPLAEAGAATIKACVAKQGGAVRILKAGGSCTGAENPLSWNSVGV